MKQSDKPNVITRPTKASRRDVAKAAGVSVTTVTHALNPEAGGRVNAATAERVKRAAQELGYRPNFVGRALVSGRNLAVAAILPGPQHARHQLYQDIMFGMAQAMQPHDYVPMLMFESDDNQPLIAIEQGRVDGIFVVTSTMDNTAINEIMTVGLPTVVVNKHCNIPDNLPVGCVRSDHEIMIADIVNELVELGCRKLLFVIDVRYIDANFLAYRGFVDACHQHRDQGVVGTTINPAHESDCRVEFRNAMQSDIRWDGIITDKLSHASVILDEAQAVGMKPNQDFFMITTDTQDGATTHAQLEYAAYTQTPVTVGREAWRLLHALIEGQSPDPKMVKVPYQRHPVACQQTTTH